MLKIDERLRELYYDALDIIESNDKYILFGFNDLEEAMCKVTSVTVNNRCTSRCGVCKYKGNTAQIEISRYMLDLPREEILTTMVHELLHTFKDSRGHGGNWKRRAVILSKISSLEISRLHNLDGYDLPKKHYVSNKSIDMKCEKCGLVLHRTRETNFTRNPEKYRCSVCCGKFVRCN